MPNPQLYDNTGATSPQALVSVQDVAEKGAANGYASLGAGGLVPTSQLPAFVSALNALTGAVTLAAGANVTLTPAGNTITIASTAAGGGIGAKLFDSTLGSAASAIDTGAGGIAGGHDALDIYIIARTTEAVVTSTLLITFNNDTGANYDREFMTGQNVTVSAGNNLGANNIVTAVFGANATAGLAATLVGSIPGYDQTTFHKMLMLNNARGAQVAADSGVALTAGHWRSTAAITRLAITAGSGNLAAGSRLIVYGRT